MEMANMKQYHDNGSLWEYTIGGEQCTCGCNVFHHECNEARNKVFVVCNACDCIIGEYKDEYIEKELAKGVWK